MSQKLLLVVATVFSLFVFLFDRGLKYFFTQSATSQNLWGDYLKLELATNSGIAFGLPVNLFFLIFLTLVILVVLVWFLVKYWREQKICSVWALELVAVGAFSNLLDRLYQGRVVDYISVKYFTVFNLADVMICIGVAVLFFASVNQSQKK